jgi:hypothetical protein
MTDGLVVERGGYFAELVKKHGVLAVPSAATPIAPLPRFCTRAA